MGGGRGTTQGKGYGTSETSQGATSAPEVVRDNYIPIFDGQPSSYREYRMRVNLYLKKMALSNKKAEATINLLTSLAGPVWKQVEHLADTAPDQDDGFETILKELDRVYQYDARVEMPKAFEKFFYGLSRPPGQTLIHYCSNHREAARELEKHDVKLPDPVGGWLLLRRSSLSQEQRQLVLSQLENKKLSVAAVEQSLFYLFGQDYKGSRVETHRPTGRGRGYSNYRWQPSRAHYAYTAEDEEYLDYQDNDYYEEAEPSYYEDEPEVYEEIEEPEPPAEESAEATYYGLDDEDEETEEAYAAYLDARRRLAEVKASRGYYPVVAVDARCSHARILERQSRKRPWRKRKAEGHLQGRAASTRWTSPERTSTGRRHKMLTLWTTWTLGGSMSETATFNPLSWWFPDQAPERRGHDGCFRTQRRWAESSACKTEELPPWWEATTS